MGTSVDDAFCVHAQKVITNFSRTEDHVHAVSGHESSSTFGSEQDDELEKEGIAKTNKICVTYLVAEHLYCLPPRERKIFKAAQKSSQALGTHHMNDFKVLTRTILAHKNEAREDVALAEKNFRGMHWRT